MTERVQIPFAELRALQQEAETTWNSVHSSCLHGPRELRVLTGAIDEQLRRANELEAAHGPIVKTVTDTARERLQTAHKECSDQFIDRWIDDITSRVVDLRYASPTLSQTDLQKKIREIRATILDLRENHMLGDENRKYLRFAEDLLRQLESGKVEPRPRTSNEKTVAVDFSPVATQLGDSTLAMTLCEIAHLFFSDNTRDALDLFHSLDKTEQHELTLLAKSIGGLIEGLESDDEEVFLNTSMAFSRAAIARANMYAENGAGIPSDEDIVALFDEGF